MIDPMREETWSYERLDRETNRLANALKAHGVGAGDVVLYQLYNSPQFVYCYIAPQKLGAVNEPVNFNLSPGETARLIDRDKPKAYIYDWDVKDMAHKALALCRHRPALVAAVDYRGLHPALPEGHPGAGRPQRGPGAERRAGAGEDLPQLPQRHSPEPPLGRAERLPLRLPFPHGGPGQAPLPGG